MNKSRILVAVKRALNQNSKLSKNDDYVFFCPKHDHHKPKLCVNVQNEKFHCWLCDWGGKNLLPILRLGNNIEDINEYIAHIGLAKCVYGEKKEYDTPILPKEFVPLNVERSSPYRDAALRYLSNRGLTYKDIELWKLGFCDDGEYKYRIIIPSFDEFGCLNFFVGRSIYDWQSLKYKHGNFCKDIIWNDCMVDWNKSIVITEGPFDAMKARNNVIALQGSILTSDMMLFGKIVKNANDVYFAMDDDAFDKQLKIIDMFVSYGIKCFYINTGERKDVGEMSHEEFIKRKSEALPIESNVDMLKMRVSR